MCFLQLDWEFESKMIMYTVAEDHMGDNEIAQVSSIKYTFLPKVLKSLYLLCCDTTEDNIR